jgi:coenzyme F420-0:L-glutamate ligase / coenzyme F420-1:gamma-L-glutamate ligase
MNTTLQIIPVTGLPMIKYGDNLSKLIFDSMKNSGNLIRDGDILIITHKIVSKSEGRIVDLKTISASQPAKKFADYTGKDPRLVEVILKESKAVRRMAPGVLITETMQGFICANAGLDKSNVEGFDTIALLPADPDLSSERIRLEFVELGVKVAVIISDTHGRAHRCGEVNVAIGASGIDVIRDRRGERDLFGYELKVKQTAIADELAAAAELAMGQANESIPAAIIRGYDYRKTKKSKASDLVWPREKDFFP